VLVDIDRPVVFKFMVSAKIYTTEDVTILTHATSNSKVA
jgi:hypothetical protein